MELFIRRTMYWSNSILYGIFPLISSYVLMPYEHQIFYLGTILSPWMLALVWIFGMIKPRLSKRNVSTLILLGSILFVSDMFVSFQSPCPPFVNTTRGNILVLILWLSTYVLLEYPRLLIANYVQNHSSSGMFWYGVNVQSGALIGSISAYLSVETFSLLHKCIYYEWDSEKGTRWYLFTANMMVRYENGIPVWM